MSPEQVGALGVFFSLNFSLPVAAVLREAVWPNGWGSAVGQCVLQGQRKALLGSLKLYQHADGGSLRDPERNA